MKYEKPELRPLGSASEGIQTNMKGPGPVETHVPFQRTIGAYVADE